MPADYKVDFCIRCSCHQPISSPLEVTIRGKVRQPVAAFLSPPITCGGACARTGVGPYAAWMPRKSLHGCTCGVSHAGTRASARSEPKNSHATC
ncbi:hypothetical protein E1J24_07565 [Xanthomonas hortorum pv. pelargonii]|uniref:CENP-V/GFA domain-containing protein n=1 Tax=Xanthomonas hortorum pv. pelargonii TaxID=453602 RepID=A0AAW9ZP20_9XANT|nr:hypothetical protein [Xanthomonas hortorum pv. pelargonii]